MIDVLLNNPSEKPVSGKTKVSDGSDKPLKSIMKSISWRIVGTLDTMIISYFITGRISVALSIGSVEVLTKTILYYFHERLWAHIHKIRLRLWRKNNVKLWEKTNRDQYEIKRVESTPVGQNN